jgi:hypothetical protein
LPVLLLRLPVLLLLLLRVIDLRNWSVMLRVTSINLDCVAIVMLDLMTVLILCVMSVRRADLP